MQIPCGTLLDRFGLHRYVVPSIVLCAFGTAFLAFSDHLWMGSLARLLIGLGSSCSFVTVLVVAEREFPKEYFPIVSGVSMLIGAIGSVGGELPLSLAVEHLGWRQTLQGLAVVGLGIAALLWLLTRQEERPKKPAARSHSRYFKKHHAQSQSWWIAAYAFLNFAPLVAVTSLWGVPYLERVYGYSHHTAASLMSMQWIGVGLSAPLSVIFRIF